MTIPLYEEALADVRSLRSVAEDNAKRAVVEAVIPRIRELIENQLIDETAPMDQSEEELLGSTDQETGHPPSDPLNPAFVRSEPRACPAGPTVSTELPVDADVQIDVIDPNDEVVQGEDEYVLDMDSVDKLAPIVSVGKTKDVEYEVRRLEALLVSERVKARKIVESNVSSERIRKLLTRVEHMYDHVQESMVYSKDKDAFEERLERVYKELNEMKESSMKNLREADEELDLDVAGGNEIKFTLTGLKTDDSGEINLDDASIEMEMGEETPEEEPSDLSADTGDEELDLDLDMDSEGGEGTEGDDDSDDLDLDSKDESTMIEIDEAMLARELRKMRRINESEKAPSADGTKPGSEEFDDFGDAVPAKGKKMQEAEACGEGCTKEQEEDELTKKDMLQKEGLRQRMLRKRIARLQSEGRKASGSRRAAYKRAFDVAMESLKESRMRSEKIQKALNESKKRVGRSNIDTRRHAEHTVAETVELRKQLAEKNLLNAKLIFTNKVLQNESLNSSQKASVIERLDESKSVNEAKMVYERAVKQVAKAKEKMTESRVRGNSSRPVTQSSPAQLNEGFEISRWAKLAGLNK